MIRQSRSYKFTLLTKAAWYVQRYLLPSRVHAWIWLAAYESLDEHMRDVTDLQADGSIECYNAIDAVRLEILKRTLCMAHLHAVTETTVLKPGSTKSSQA